MTKYASIQAMFSATAAEHKKSPAFVYSDDKDSWQTISWGDYKSHVDALCASMRACGLQHQEKVAILSPNCPEWVMVSVAAMCTGGIPCGIYPTSSPDQSAFILNDSQSKILFCKDASLLKGIKTVWAQLPSLKWVVLFSGEDDDPRVLSWNAFQAKGAQSSDATNTVPANLDDVATLVYTSGTTSNPKAVQLTQGNIMWMAETNCQHELSFSHNDRMVSYLPLSHVAEQMITVFGPLFCGAQIWFAKDLMHLPKTMTIAKPTVFFGVPRVWEKIQARITSEIEAASPLRKMIGKWCLKVGATHPKTSLAWKLAQRLMYQPLRKKLGLDQSRILVSAAAPIALETLNFFESLDMALCEVYGMSECCGPATISMPGRSKRGFVGQALLGTEVKIAEDGELLIRGPHVFKGYLNKPEDNPVDSNGWLHSGDLAASDSEGFIKITGRKKNIIITAGGENIAPEMIEGKLAALPAVEHAVVVGDRRKYLTALLTLQPTQTMSQDFEVQLKERIAHLNKDLARVQTIKSFKILPHGFSEASGELTPTQKVKRAYVIQKYAKEIDELYAKN